jgi:RNA polymerase sigma-70 factor (ECF subfamily)
LGRVGVMALAEPGRGEALSSQDLIRLYQKRVYAVLVRMAGNRAEVEDLCPETFLQILRNPGGVATARDRDAWVYRIAMNVAIDFLRRKTRDRGLADKAAAGRASVSPPPVTEPQSAAWAALDQLEPHYRQVVVLRVLEGLSFDQIAIALDSTPGTVRWRLFEARRKLAELLTPYLKDMEG